MSSYLQVLGHRISLLLLACTTLMNDSQVCSFTIQEGHKKAAYGFTGQLLFESWLGHLLRVLTVPTLCKGTSGDALEGGFSRLAKIPIIAGFGLASEKYSP